MPFIYKNFFALTYCVKSLAFIAALTTLTFSASSYSQPEPVTKADQNVEPIKTIRFYRANKHDQRIRLTASSKKTDIAGCYNFKKAKRVATVVQLGYASCTVYSEKNCNPETSIRATHSKQDAFALKLAQGHGWQLKKSSEKDLKGVKVRSWSCE